MEKERILLTDSIQSAIVKLVEGNPGAITACLELVRYSPEIDPDSALGHLTPLLSLDTNRIYGPRIWMLYKDVCQSDPIKVLALLRGVQLGILGQNKLRKAIDNRGEGVDIDEIIEKVYAILPEFNRLEREKVTNA